MRPYAPDDPAAAAVERRYARLLSNFTTRSTTWISTLRPHRSVFQSGAKFCAPPEGRGLAAMLEAAADTLIHPEDKADFRQMFRREELRRALATTGRSTGAEYRKKCLDGSYRWVRVMVFPFDESGLERYLICFQDIDGYKHLGASTRENVLLHLQSLDYLRYRAITEQTRSLVFEWQDQTLFTHGRHDSRLLAGSYDGRHLFDLWREDSVLFPKIAPYSKTSCAPWPAATPPARSPCACAAGRAHSHRHVVSCTRIDNTATGARYVGSIRDVDKAIHTARALRQQAEYDDLTGACTMPTFLGKTERLLRRNPDAPRHIVRYDVAGFKSIDERFGQEEGRRLLRAISYLTKENLSSDREIFARLSGDIFSFLGGRPRARLGIHGMAALRHSGIHQVLPARTLFRRRRADDPATPVREICERAYLALKSVKGSGMADYAFYDDELRSRVLDELFIKDQMYTALAEGQFVVYPARLKYSAGALWGPKPWPAGGIRNAA